MMPRKRRNTAVQPVADQLMDAVRSSAQDCMADSPS